MGILKTISRTVGKLVGAEDPQDKAAQNAAKQVALNSAINNRSIRAQQDAVAKQLTRRESKRKRGRDATIITSGTDIQSKTLLG